MIPEPFTATAMILKGVGAISGATIALLIKPAQTAAEFWTRLGCSVLSGFLFGTPLREHIGWEANEEYMVVAAALAAIIAWWALAAIVRMLEKWDGIGWTKK